MSATYKKLSKENRSQFMQLEYDELNQAVQLLARQVGDEEALGYYEGKRDELQLKWLNGGGDSEHGNGASAEQNYIWHANMPISLWQCREVFEAAEKGLPKKSVEDLVFGDYDMDSNERVLFEVCYYYGQACGLNTVCTELYEGAKAGDPRAVKMYLEVSGLLEKSEIEQEELNRKRLVRIKMDI